MELVFDVFVSVDIIVLDGIEIKLMVEVDIINFDVIYIFEFEFYMFVEVGIYEMLYINFLIVDILWCQFVVMDFIF